jgi:phenylacetic acid degradation protein
MNGIYEFEGLVPVVDPTAYVHPSAVLIGDVIVGPGVYIGPHAVLRGDFGRIVLNQGSNLQDTCVIHAFPDCETTIERDGHIGHGAVLHGCTIGRNAMVGMNAVIMDNAIIGAEAIVAALAFVKADMHVPPRSLVAGIPARIVRDLTTQEIEWKTAGTAVYQQLAQRSRNGMRPAEPLRAVESNRRRLPRIQGFKPLFKLRRQAAQSPQEKE